MTSASGVAQYMVSAMEAKMSEVKDFWAYCPMGGKRHGVMQLMKNDAGGLLVYCEKCYKPRRKRGS